MPTLQTRARAAGWTYLLLVVLGITNLMLLPGKFLVPGDPAASARAILAQEGLYRVWVASSLASVVVFLLLSLRLYRLFQDVDREQAALMAILVLVQIPLGFLDGILQLGVLSVLKGPSLPALADPATRDTLAGLLLALSRHATTVSETFWGLWLLPLGLLVIRSRFLPTFLGVWLILNGLAYVALSALGILAPDLGKRAFLAFQPFLFGEMAFTLWLLFRGARPGTEPAPA